MSSKYLLVLLSVCVGTVAFTPPAAGLYRPSVRLKMCGTRRS